MISDTARGESAWETKCEGGVLGGRGTGDDGCVPRGPVAADLAGRRPGRRSCPPAGGVRPALGRSTRACVLGGPPAHLSMGPARAGRTG